MPQPITVPINRLHCHVFGWDDALGIALGVGASALAPKPSDGGASALNKKLAKPTLQAMDQFTQPWLSSIGNLLNSPGMNDYAGALGAVNSQGRQALDKSISTLQSGLLQRGMGSADATSLAPMHATYAQYLADAQRQVPLQMMQAKINLLADAINPQRAASPAGNLTALGSQQYANSDMSGALGQLGMAIGGGAFSKPNMPATLLGLRGSGDATKLGSNGSLWEEQGVPWAPVLNVGKSTVDFMKRNF